MLFSIWRRVDSERTLRDTAPEVSRVRVANLLKFTTTKREDDSRNLTNIYANVPKSDCEDDVQDRYDVAASFASAT